MTKDGLKKPNYFGSLTHAATVRGWLRPSRMLCGQRCWKQLMEGPHAAACRLLVALPLELQVLQFAAAV